MDGAGSTRLGVAVAAFKRGFFRGGALVDLGTEGRRRLLSEAQEVAASRRKRQSEEQDSKEGAGPEAVSGWLDQGQSFRKILPQ